MDDARCAAASRGTLAASSYARRRYDTAADPRVSPSSSSMTRYGCPG